MLLFFGIVYVAVIIQRLWEVGLAKRNAAYIRAQGGYEVGAGHYRYLVALHVCFFLSLLYESLQVSRLPQLWWLPFGCFLLAQCGRYWCIASLGRFWNTRIFVLPGASLVNRGPYRFLRHPNYCIVAIELYTLPATFGAYGTAVIFTLLNLWLLLRVRIPLEEETLETLAKEET
ncbi:isoprenylcysteine carboxyl methyltransferase family protein [Brevibacillus fulvus]|uniref:Methyltransferase n=1 Tax=Brevibacillus fulvus TaxID=1125967 RepID=A0A939BRC0_9BACL|nr:isoprenylcysteine carboxylmethyltransferase family protein [Brevibacillus fulvus]MBM7589442.1 methyltransferase [Brevibacillus fulvus]